MPYSHKTYLLTETAVGSAISLVLSIVFVFLIFDSNMTVPIYGLQGLIVDSVPQSFAIAFMATLMPTFLTRIRLKAGKIKVIDGRGTWLPQNVFLRSLTMAILVTIVAYSAHFVAFGMTGFNSLSFTNALIYKACYGAFLGATVAYYSLLNALSAKSRV
ncbi:MAG: hypothetical protein NWQ54_20850 [Paraglaciecola sp.]|uniref:hypothetical protein n=1 Tax=Paraglaciecola sp. TaxID=1920173 RepID=UPI00273F613F|nr:hypothetical protein [Paraglaciecola sp.]MDP5031642.1 hypothetical protein [Paraglaciecola sp.]MDP5133337.1 hypothetical protein [Paraglaciecola sp.]